MNPITSTAVIRPSAFSALRSSTTKVTVSPEYEQTIGILAGCTVDVRVYGKTHVVARTSEAQLRQAYESKKSGDDPAEVAPYLTEQGLQSAIERFGGGVLGFDAYSLLDRDSVARVHELVEAQPA